MAEVALLLVERARSMSLVAHLEELRKRIILSVCAVVVGFLSCWSFADRIFGLMQRPIIGALRHHGIAGGLVYLNPTEPFNLYLEVALVGGLFAASPFVFYQLWLFIAPGLVSCRRGANRPSANAFGSAYCARASPRACAPAENTLRTPLQTESLVAEGIRNSDFRSFICACVHPRIVGTSPVGEPRKPRLEARHRTGCRSVPGSRCAGT
jgi:hypothetical protein